jgi:15-cis-phytoene synthase
MIPPPTALAPPFLLAITYAPREIRPRLRWLLQFDQSLRDVLDRAKEPMIVQLRLAWWRDALMVEPSKRPKGAPIFAALALLEPEQVLIGAALSLTDATEVLGCDPEPAGREAASQQRIQALCGAYLRWVEGSEQDAQLVDQIGAAWADPMVAMPKSVPKKLRPLSILAIAEHFENGVAPRGVSTGALRLNWHALTGR